MSSNNIENGGSSSQKTKGKKKGRGPAILERLNQETEGNKRHVVVYNSKGQPIGQSRRYLSSYEGYLARERVPINHVNWHKVSKHIKANLWTAIQGKFEVDPNSRTSILASIGVAWRTFRTNLTKNYINPFKDQPEQLQYPPEEYGKVTQKDWREFVKSRLSEDFQILSKAQRERRAKNKYNHRISKRGYADLTEDLKKELGMSPEDDIDRSLLWKRARQNKNGEYVDDATREKANEIDKLTKQLEEGSIVIEGSNDILTMVLGNREHGGRVRGVGKYVTPTRYFNISRRGSKKHTRELESKLLESEQREKELRDQVKKLQEQIQHQTPPLATI